MVEMNEGPEEDEGSLCRRKDSEVDMEDAEVYSILENFSQIGNRKESSKARASVIRVCEGAPKIMPGSVVNRGKGNAIQAMDRQGLKVRE